MHELQETRRFQRSYTLIPSENSADLREKACNRVLVTLRMRLDLG